MDNNDWIDAQKNRLKQNSSIEGPHSCWICKLGGLNRRYSTMTVRFPNEDSKKTVYSHRLSYMLYNNIFDVSSTVHISHRCHNKRCVNPEHLSGEPEHVNQDRQICRGIFPTRCKKHDPFPECLL